MKAPESFPPTPHIAVPPKHVQSLRDVVMANEAVQLERHLFKQRKPVEQKDVPGLVRWGKPAQHDNGARAA